MGGATGTPEVDSSIEKSGRLPPLDLHDLVRLGAAGRHDLDLRALLLADERARDRRGDRDLSLLGVGFRFADDRQANLLLGILVDQGSGRAELVCRRGWF